MFTYFVKLVLILKNSTNLRLNQQNMPKIKVNGPNRPFFLIQRNNLFLERMCKSASSQVSFPADMSGKACPAKHTFFVIIGKCIQLGALSLTCQQESSSRWARFPGNCAEHAFTFSVQKRHIFLNFLKKLSIWLINFFGIFS